MAHTSLRRVKCKRCDDWTNSTVGASWDAFGVCPCCLLPFEFDFLVTLTRHTTYTYRQIMAASAKRCHEKNKRPIEKPKTTIPITKYPKTAYELIGY